MRLIAAFVCSLLLISLGIAPSHAEKRIALVIGNSAYRSAAELPNARNDAKTIAKLLTDAGFDVVQSKSDLGAEEFRRALRDFADLSDDADVALVYFAGHGIELSGENYLVPVDARLARDRDAEDEAISLDRLLHTVEPARRLKLVILDACRENPFVAKMSRLSPTRSIGRGLARVDPAASDTLVAFAAKAGSTAADGDGTNSPFTKALLAHLTTPGLDVRIALGRVRDQVLKETNRQQEPFLYGSLGGDIVSLVPTKTQTAPPLQSTRPVSKTESTDIGSVRSIHDQWQVRCQLAVPAAGSMRGHPERHRGRPAGGHNVGHSPALDREENPASGPGAAWNPHAVRSRIEDRRQGHRPGRFRALPRHRLRRGGHRRRRLAGPTQGRKGRAIHHFPNSGRGNRHPHIPRRACRGAW